MLRLCRRHIRPDGRLLFSVCIDEAEDVPLAFAEKLEESLASGDQEMQARFAEALALREVGCRNGYWDAVPERPLEHARAYTKWKALELIEGTGWEVMSLRPALRVHAEPGRVPADRERRARALTTPGGSGADGVVAAVDVDDLAGGRGEPVRQQRDHGLRRRARCRGCPTRAAPARPTPPRTARSRGSTRAASVRSGPAATRFTRIRRGPSSRARYRAVDSNAAFATPIQS